MLLKRVEVSPFKSINAVQTVKVDDSVTVLVGMNEAGKTVFLKALEKSVDALGSESFDPVDDYPRKDLAPYLKKHANSPEKVTMLTYSLSDGERVELGEHLHIKVPADFEFTISHKYDNNINCGVSLDERPAVEWLAANSTLSGDAKAAVAAAASLRNALDALGGMSLTAEDQVVADALTARAEATKWDSIIEGEAAGWLYARRPKFLYFGDYEVLPSKVNLTDLANRVAQAKTNKKALSPEHLGILALLRMADISVEDFTQHGYEPLKARIEAVSIRLTDQIMEFWKQNEDLTVEIDIKPDPDDLAPFNNGPNLYLRIRNMRHRGVSTPFKQRSRGFIWFFSFLVWFDEVQQQIAAGGFAGERGLILLLDEPGLSLHALAQADFLRYIDQLSERHQVLYTTHSPFMVHMDRMQQIRVVEDKVKTGTAISDNITGSDPRTIFPLQAALGWTLAQSLFISRRNLLVEGPSDLLYLTAVSRQLEALGKHGLRDDITIVPAGGLDKLATFIALLGANGLEFAVFHDFNGSPDQRLINLVRQKLLPEGSVLSAADFLDGDTTKPCDLEDLLAPNLYLSLFTSTFAKLLGGAEPKLTELPPGDRIILRLESWLKAKNIQLRPSGGFNHYAVAATFAQQAPALDQASLSRFEKLFSHVNGVFEA